MTSELHAQQEWEWATLYDRIKSVLQQYGEADDGTEEKDYLLMDDNLGWYKHTIETNKLELMQPVVAKSSPLLKPSYAVSIPAWCVSFIQSIIAPDAAGWPL